MLFWQKRKEKGKRKGKERSVSFWEMDISVMFLKLSALKMAPQAAGSGMPTDSDNMVAAARGCQRKAVPKI